MLSAFGGENLTYLPGVGPATGSGSYQFKNGQVAYPGAGVSLPITATTDGLPFPTNFSAATPGNRGTEYFVQEDVPALNQWIRLFNQMAPIYVPGSPL